MLGLVWEHVLFEEKNPFREQGENPSCFKGGELESDWSIVDYGYSRGNYYSNILGGFRLIRNIGNNVKWSNDKVQKTEVKSNEKSYDFTTIGKKLDSLLNSLKIEPLKRITPQTDTTKQKRKQK